MAVTYCFFATASFMRAEAAGVGDADDWPNALWITAAAEVAVRPPRLTSCVAVYHSGDKYQEESPFWLK